MKKSTISADIVAFTSLSNKNKSLLESELKKLKNTLNKKFNVFFRLVKGDYIECVIPQPENALKIALLIKCFIKSLKTTNDEKDKRYKYFKNYGVRIAIGYGTLKRYNPKTGIIDGEAIYMSGRKISNENSHNKQRKVIKNTLFFLSNNNELEQNFAACINLLDFILNKATAKQCEVLYYKLLEYSEKEITKLMKISQPVVNQHSLSVGWNAIEKTVNYFNHKIKEQ